MVCPASASSRQVPSKIAHDDRREPLERLVKQQNLRLAHQRAGDRQHLLLAAGKIGAAAGAPLLEPREHGIDALERPTLRRRQAGEDEIFLDIEAAENAAIFVHELHAGLRDGVALFSGDLDAVEHGWSRRAA